MAATARVSERITWVTTGGGAFALGALVKVLEYYGYEFLPWVWALWGVAMALLSLVCVGLTLHLAWLELRKRGTSMLTIGIIVAGMTILGWGAVRAAKEWAPPKAGSRKAPPAVASEKAAPETTIGAKVATAVETPTGDRAQPPQSEARPPSDDHVKPEAPPAANAQDDQKRVLNQLTQLYVLTHDDISPRMLAGLELPPVDWLNAELEKQRATWRVRSADGANAETYKVPGGRPAKKKAEEQLPISVSPIDAPTYAKLSGLRVQIQDGTTVEPPILVTREIFISNSSLDRTVTLRINLLAHWGEAKVFKMSGDGKDMWGHQMGTHDSTTKHHSARGMQPPSYILSPVTIRPQETVIGSLVFVATVIDTDDPNGPGPWFIRHAVGLSPDRFRYELLLEDVVSQKSLSLQLPSKAYPSGHQA